jgi:hypothetical protein
MAMPNRFLMSSAAKPFQRRFNRNLLFRTRNIPLSLFTTEGIRGLTIEQLQEKDTWGGNLRQRVVILGSGKSYVSVK